MLRPVRGQPGRLVSGEARVVTLQALCDLLDTGVAAHRTLSQARLAQLVHPVGESRSSLVSFGGWQSKSLQIDQPPHPLRANAGVKHCNIAAHAVPNQVHRSLWRQMVEQGKIGMILSTRPADRRQLIEEAAGIAKYKSRRRQAELKLEAAEQNLTRVDDIIFEVEKQRGTLKRQAAKARRYQRLREELRRWEQVQFAHRYRTLSKDIERADALLGAAREREAVAAAHLAEIETALEGLRLNLTENEAKAIANAKVNRNVREANEEREGVKHVGGFKSGGKAKRATGGGVKDKQALGGIDPTPKRGAAQHYKKGGKVKKADGGSFLQRTIGGGEKEKREREIRDVGKGQTSNYSQIGRAHV